MSTPTVTHLRRLQLFRRWTRVELAAIAKVARLRHVPVQTVLFREGDRGDVGYAVVSGQVAIRKESLSHEETAITTLTIGPGEFFGELSLLDAGPRSSTAITTEPCTLVIITKAAFSRLLQRDPRVGAKLFLLLIKRLGPRIRQMNTELMALYETGKAIGASDALEPFLERLLTIALRATSARRGCIFLANEVTNQWDVTVTCGAPPPPNDPLPLDDQRTLLGHCAHTREPLLIDPNRGYITTPPPIPQPYESPTMLLVPILIGQRAIGVVFLGDKRSTQGHACPFRPDDRNLCSVLAAQAAATIERIKLASENTAREQLKQVRFSL